MDMIEKVAMAIYKAEPFGPDLRRDMPWSDVAESQKVGFRVKAVAAIEALRDPSSAMMEAGFRDGDDGFGHVTEFEAGEIWGSMIDAALKVQ